MLNANSSVTIAIFAMLSMRKCLLIWDTVTGPETCTNNLYSLYRYAKPNRDWPKNMLLLKIPNFLRNNCETWSKWETVANFYNFLNDFVKIVDIFNLSQFGFAYLYIHTFQMNHSFVGSFQHDCFISFSPNDYFFFGNFYFIEKGKMGFAYLYSEHSPVSRRFQVQSPYLIHIRRHFLTT